MQRHHYKIKLPGGNKFGEDSIQLTTHAKKEFDTIY